MIDAFEQQSSRGVVLDGLWCLEDVNDRSDLSPTISLVVVVDSTRFTPFTRFKLYQGGYFCRGDPRDSWTQLAQIYLWRCKDAVNEDDDKGDNAEEVPQYK